MNGIEEKELYGREQPRGKPPPRPPPRGATRHLQTSSVEKETRWSPSAEFTRADGADSDSSSSASEQTRRVFRDLSMEEQRPNQRGSPLRAVVTPTTVDRTRCSTYDNIEGFSSRKQGGKPPIASKSARVTGLNQDCDPNLLMPPHHRPFPVVGHYRQEETMTTPLGYRSSPSGRHSAPSPNRFAMVSGSSGRSTPVRSGATEMDMARSACSPWKELDHHHEDSTDSDHMRKRPSSSCGMSSRHRGEMWHHRSCSPCHPMRCHWHGTVPPPHQSSCGCHGGYMLHNTSPQSHNNYEDLQQKIYQLESEREHLMLQVSVLNEQVDAQNEKIKELESTLIHSKEQLCHSEAMLQREMESSSVLEHGKLELTTQVSSLRIRLSSIEQERREFQERNNKLQGELVITCACLAEKEADLATLKSNLSDNNNPDVHIDQNSEVQKLKTALCSVIAANDEKERKIQELNMSLNRYKKLQELVIANHKRRDTESPVFYDRNHYDDFGQFDINGKIDTMSLEDKLMDKPPLVPRSSQSSAMSSPLHEVLLNIRETESLRCSPIPNHSLISGSVPVLHKRAKSSDNVSPLIHKTPPAKRHYGTVPRPHGNEILLQIHQQLQQHRVNSPSSASSTLERNVGRKVSQSSQSLINPTLDNQRQSRSKTSGVSFGRGFFKLRSGKRSSSAPELVSEDGTLSRPHSIHTPIPPYRRTSSPGDSAKSKRKGLKKLFGKLKRTESENLDSQSAEFRRGGVRSTAGPRLGWVQNGNKLNNFNVPFTQWNSSTLSDWLQTLGLGMYSSDCKKRIKNGAQLVKSTCSDFEKELGIKNPLHRKKLLLAVIGTDSGDIYPFSRIDYHWSVRWLDDIGLPQYKDAFFDARVDGSMLHHLTVEDLFNLKVTNQLHHISIKRGIQVLRENNFDPQCLKRRFIQDEEEESPTEASKWSNHRVMEWLKTVDLSEYAPNLRGSGVHGGLMVYEPLFNAELLATLLNIPPNKTLLRRHLSTQFKQLVGNVLIQQKRECESQPNYTALSPSAKVKVIRRSQISLIRRRTKGEKELEEYVCPMSLGNLCEGPNKEYQNGNPSPQPNGQQQKPVSKEGIGGEKVLDKLSSTNV